MEYTNDFELLLKRHGEMAESMSILHHYAHQKYSRYSNYTNIPVIVLSILTSVLSNIDMGFEKQTIFISGISVCATILKTLDSYFDYTKRCQNHINISNQYKSISNLLQIQLSLEKDKRIAYNDLLNLITNEIDTIHKSEPVIDDDIIVKYNLKYKDEKVNKPNIVNGLTNIRINSNLSPTTETPSFKLQEIKHDNKIKVGIEI